MATAIVTTHLKKQLIQQLFDDIADSANTNYYIGIGKSEDWNDSDTAPVPVDTLRDERDFRLSMQSMKQVVDYSFVVPRVNWSSGQIYSAFNDRQEGQPTQSHYVITESNQVYVCIRQSKNAVGTPQVSTVEPTGVTAPAFSTADGYAWKFLYTIPAIDASNYMSASHMPVKLQTATDSSSLASEVEQEGIQNAAIPGQLAGFGVTLAGSGYDSAPSVSIVGNGVNASAVATISGGAVTKIEFADSGTVPLQGSGYDWANIVLTGGSPDSAATGFARFGPRAGFGADPRDDLKSTGMMFVVKPTGSEAGVFIVDNSFRQIGLIKNPEIPDSDGLYSTLTGNALKRYPLSATTTAFTAGSTLTGGTSSAKAIIDRVEGTELYLHFTEALGFTPFTEGEGVTDAAGGSGTLDSAGADGDSDAFNVPSVDPMSGSLLWLLNQAKVDRDSDQTEDLKVIVEI